ncbi:MAG: peptidoglycan-associated lipoprotein [Beggiatoa sp. IS2]|nr:MAG: peptidoglycan-associated lipoprotein [Beggiatoa sp. IS2]
MKKIPYIFLVIIAMIFTGCSSIGKEPGGITPVRPSVVSPVITGGQRDSSGGMYGGGGGFGGSGNMPMDGSAAGSPGSRLVYFDFDQYTVRGDARPVVEAHAAFLVRNPNVPIRLEGHADERGSREYNLALGEKRANSVRDMLILLGVNSLQITTLSYGEERPINSGRNEMAWQLNRRVELVY